MKKWNMIVDVERCHSCFNCFVATKDEYVGNSFPGYSAPQPLHGHNWVDIERTERGQWPMVDAGFRPVMCNHCDDAPCIAAAENDAISKRDDGIVVIDPEKSKGQTQIVDACPYGAVYWNEDLDIPQAWPFDAHLLDDGWEQTRLENSCPTSVFRSLKVTDEEMMELAEADGLETLEQRSGAKPRLWYRNNHVFNTCFIGGTVTSRDARGVEINVEGAEIRLLKNGEEIATTRTDAFGDFKLDRLEPALGTVTLEVSSGLGSTRIGADLDQSLYLGCLEIGA